MSELQKHTLNLFKGDFDRVGEYYPDLGASVVVRAIVRKWLEKQEEADAPKDDLKMDF